MVQSLKKFVALLFFTSAMLIAQTNAAASEKTLLVMGDSLSAYYGMSKKAGWVNLLRDRLQQHDTDWQVINASISGETTDGGQRRLPDLLAKHQPQIVIIALGANDGLRGFPPPQIQSRLADMIRQSQSSAGVILLGIELPPNYGPVYTQAFRQVYQDLSDTYQIGLLPFMLDGIYDQPGMMQSDGLHPSDKAQPLILDLVWPLVSPLIN
ncbi:Arylesterase precursor [Methylophaga frappieri]|uniref:Arylesterase n=1 Tax=Methylophaga frappieri (strain ATCC BAA-2434 / DSM 25690 / JAM7) TaxID=754477 RepID=I1YL74_METFJ|nr:arylesterase [Methylophaga frappieri]AFJ03667.1 Arylesterase precursor [Methylophaga frappieri]